MDLVLKPVRIATSKPARQTYLNSILLVITSTTLLAIAACSYILFYMNYIPQIGIERDVHLQFGNGPNPYAFIPLEDTLVANQPYSIQLHLSLPRSPTNLAHGNFMLDLSLLSPSYRPGLSSGRISSSATIDPPFIDRSSIPVEAIIFTSRRPALITYHPRLVSLTHQILTLPWHMLPFRSRLRDAEDLSVPMAESISFPKGWSNIPKHMYVEVQVPSNVDNQGKDIQVYEMKVKLRAKFEGLRWLMYNYRIMSFVGFTGAFWTAEVLFAILTWVMWGSRTSSGDKTESGGGQNVVKTENGGGAEIKTENGEEETVEDAETDDLDLSDTPRSFPTYGRQAPLRYVAPPRVKSEDEDEEEGILEDAVIQPLEAMADDESEELVGSAGRGSGGAGRGGRSDSGIGTSFSEGGGAGGSLARRKSRGGRS